MKTIVRITILVLLLALALPIIPASAQDGEEEVSLVGISSVYLQDATSGSFEDNGDGTYTLTLNEASEQFTWVITSPGLGIQHFSTETIVLNWSEVEDLSTEAVLSVENLNILLQLSAPTFADGTQTYIAMVTEIRALDGAKDPEVPMAFDAAELSISVSQEFESGLFQGVVMRYEGIRGAEECDAARADYDEFNNVWVPAKSQERYDAIVTCYTDPDPNVAQAACQRSYDINTEISMRKYEVITALNTACN